MGKRDKITEKKLKLLNCILTNVKKNHIQIAMQSIRFNKDVQSETLNSRCNLENKQYR